MRVLHMHEEEDDQRRLDGRYGEGGDGVEGAEVDEGGSHGDAGAREQGQPDRDGRTDGGNMFGNVSGRLFGSISGSRFVIRHLFHLRRLSTYDGRSGTATGISRSRQYRRSASTVLRFQWGGSNREGICRATPCRRGIRTGRRR